MERSVAPFPVGIVVGGVLVGGGLVASSVSAIVRWRQARRWPHTEGRITESHIAGAGFDLVNTYAPAVQYTYVVDGIAFTGNRVHFAGMGSLTEAAATTEAYAPGQAVTVYYDPEDPSQAVLEHDPPLFPYFAIPAGLGAVLVALVYALQAHSS